MISWRFRYSFPFFIKAAPHKKDLPKIIVLSEQKVNKGLQVLWAICYNNHNQANDESDDGIVWKIFVVSMWK